MTRTPLVILLLLAAAPVLSHRARAEPPPADAAVATNGAAGAKRTQRGAAAAGEPIVSKLGKHLEFTLDNGLLSAKWVGDNQQPGHSENIRRPTAKLFIRFGGVIRDGAGESLYLNVARQGATGGPPGFFQLRIPKNGAPLSFNAHNLTTPEGGTFNLDVSATAPTGVRVNVSRLVDLNAGRTSVMALNASAKSWRQLAAEHPDPVRRFVAPVLRELTGIDCFPPGAGDVYRAFPQIAPDAQAVKAFARVLPRLDADDYSARRVAAAELDAIAAAGVLAALRHDRKGLSPEQIAHVEGFIASHTWQAPRTPEGAQRDPEFLVQCLAYDDPAVREAAERALEELAGRKLTFDESLAGSELSAAVDKVRLDLLEVIHPGIKIDREPPDPDENRAFAYSPVSPEQRRQQIRQMRHWEGQMLGGMKKAEQKYRLPELLEFTREGGVPKVRWTGKLMTQQPVRLDIDGRRGAWVLFRAGEFRKDNPDVMLAWSDASRNDETDGPWKINLNFANEYMAISAMYGEDADVYSVTLNVINNRVMLVVSRDLGGQPDVQAQAANLAELAQQQPEAVRKYVHPMMRDLFGIYLAPPPAAEAYATFEQIPADAGVTDRIGALLPQMDDAAADRRAGAVRELEAMGRGAVLAALRMSRDGLSHEQAGRLNAFVASRGGRRDFDAAAARRDVSFLLACLDFDDAAVRTAAKAQIEQLAGAKVLFDVALEGDARTAAIEALRKQLEASEKKE